MGMYVSNFTSKKSSKNIRLGLKSASQALLGTVLGVSTAFNAQGQSLPDGWQSDVALLVYSEPTRVSALEPAIAINKIFDDESILGMKLVLDALSGASHNGAAANNAAQTFTRPSGQGSYQAPAGETPLDDTFRDTRINFSVHYQYDVKRLEKMLWGVNVSSEYDFLSVGGSSTYLRDLNQRNTTLSAGLSFEIDSIRAVGGFADPLSAMQANTLAQNKVGSSHNRVMIESLLGITQIIDHKSLLQINYGLAFSDGEHTDPYKVVSVLDSNGDLIAANGLNGTYLYEHRPDSRIRQNVFTKLKRFVWGDVVDVSYRFAWDDWGIHSHTLDTHYRFNLSASFYLEPHLRFYQQQQADFYRHSITNSEIVPNFLSADYRLANMQANTIGVKLGFLTPSGHKSSVRFEYYQQTGNSHPSNALPNQKNIDLYPTVEAYIFQYNYKI